MSLQEQAFVSQSTPIGQSAVQTGDGVQGDVCLWSVLLLYAEDKNPPWESQAK